MKRLLAAVVLLFTACFVGSACVRLSEPKTFTCANDSDCESSERCSSGECVSNDSDCYQDYECRDGQICQNARCIAPLCKAGECGAYECTNGRCPSSCFDDDGCSSGFLCEGGACAQVGQFPNFTQCEANSDCFSKVCCADSTHVCADSCPKEVGASCAVGADCRSSYCCIATGAQSLTCSAVPCSEIPECNFDIDCPTGEQCVSQKCKVVLVKNGAACAVSSQCASGSCVSGTCRGPTGDVCTEDKGCQSGLVCCPSLPGKGTGKCSDTSQVCPFTIGAACQTTADCAKGTCGGNSWCTAPCSQNSDCGVSPWGEPNLCESNPFGVPSCFPGCESDSDCDTNLGSNRFYCRYDQGFSQLRYCSP